MPVVIILTRYFDKSKIAGSSVELDEVERLNDLVECINKGVNTNHNNIQFSFNGTKNTDLISSLRAHFKGTTGCDIDSSFHGKLRRFPNSNIFFYHHWFDNQISHGNDNNRIKMYLRFIIEQIVVILNTEKIKNGEGTKIDVLDKFEFYLFLHEGDFLKNYKGEEVKIDSIPCFKKSNNLSNNLKYVGRFSHDNGYPVWERVLNNNGIIEKLENSNNKENDLLELILYSKIDAEFKRFIEN